MKVLRGTLQETLYAWPEECSEADSEEGLTPMTVTKAMTHNQDAVTYISGESMVIFRVSCGSGSSSKINVCDSF